MAILNENSKPIQNSFVLFPCNEGFLGQIPTSSRVFCGRLASVLTFPKVGSSRVLLNYFDLLVYLCVVFFALVCFVDPLRALSFVYPPSPQLAYGVRSLQVNRQRFTAKHPVQHRFRERRKVLSILQAERFGIKHLKRAGGLCGFGAIMKTRVT
jgi:hypothetical protein